MQNHSYIDLQPEVINSIASTIRLLENCQFSFDANSLSIRKFVFDSLTDLEEISFRYQQVANPTNFETLFITVTSQKMFPFELSNSKIGEYLELPSDVSKYLPSNANIRTPLNIRVWKTNIPSVTNQTVQTIDNVEISTSLTSIDYSLLLDLGNSQILNIPQQDQVLSYLFAVTPKVVNSQTSQPIDGQKSKVTTITSEMVCLSDSPCLSVKVSDNLYSCKCSQVSYVTIAEKTTTKVQYSINTSNADYGYLAFLFFIPAILILILAIVIGVVLYKKFGKKEEAGNNVELKSI